MIDLDRYERKIMVTGGAGFIGSNLLHYMVNKYPHYLFINIDKLTYAGNLSNLIEIQNLENYRFIKGDIKDQYLIGQIFRDFGINGIINLAAESHVDRSIMGPAPFIETNILGTFTLLQESLRHMDKNIPFRFHQVSTDEVFGSLGSDGYFREESRYNPSSPYAASKASSDHFVNAFNKTYGLDTVISNSSNNYGPYQFVEKLIPLMIYNGMKGNILPVYGDGCQVRDWLYIADHCQALDLLFHQGHSGRTYNIGGNNEIKNIELVEKICQILNQETGKDGHEKLIRFVEDRPGHDRRYAIDASVIKNELGWRPGHSFDEGLRKTVKWYMEHMDWIESCVSREYMEYYDKWYKRRLDKKNHAE